MNTFYLVKNAITTGAGASLQNPTGGVANLANRTFQASGSVSASTGEATIKIQVSNDGDNWIDLGAITLTLGTSVTSDGIASFAAWYYVRANVTALSGTNATVNVLMSI